MCKERTILTGYIRKTVGVLHQPIKFLNVFSTHSVKCYNTALKLFFLEYYVTTLSYIVLTNSRKFPKIPKFRKFRKTSGNFLRENSGKFSPGFSCIFRG